MIMNNARDRTVGFMSLFVVLCDGWMDTDFVLRLEVLFARSQVVKRHFLSHEVLLVVPTLNFFDSDRKSTRKIWFLAKHGTHLIFCSSPLGKSHSFILSAKRTFHSSDKLFENKLYRVKEKKRWCGFSRHH